jgi:hypothetical protein
MRRVFLAGLIAVFLSAAPQKQEQTAGTFRGVIDQRDTEYMLVNDQNMEPIAVLRGRGFEKENFARFLGDPVEIKGRMTTENGRKVLLVRSVEDVRRMPVPERK